MLSIEHLTIVYERAPVLNDLSVAIEAGQIHGLVGRNGAGKTTLLDAIYGFVRPRTGSITFNGVPLRRVDVGYLPTELHFYPRVTGREHLQVFCVNRHEDRLNPNAAIGTGSGNTRSTTRSTTRSNARGHRPGFDADAWADIFDLPLDRFVDAYSSGMRRKLAIIGVLALGRPVLVMDEPANGLDVEANQLLGKLLRVLAECGRTVLVTSHVLEALTAMCDRVHVLSDGRIAANYAPPDFGCIAEHLLSADATRKMKALHALATGNHGA